MSEGKILRPIKLDRLLFIGINLRRQSGDISGFRSVVNTISLAFLSLVFPPQRRRTLRTTVTISCVTVGGGPWPFFCVICGGVHGNAEEEASFIDPCTSLFMCCQVGVFKFKVIVVSQID